MSVIIESCPHVLAMKEGEDIPIFRAANSKDAVTCVPLLAEAGHMHKGALAANSCGLRTIFTLLCTHPDHVEIMEDGEYKDIPLKNCKSIGKRKFERK